MTDCAYYMELISAELDGELTEAERARLTAHLEQCPACRRYRQALASVSGALADSLEPPPATLARSVMARVRTLPCGVPRAGGRPGGPGGEQAPPGPGPARLAALAAALALVVWAGYKALPCGQRRPRGGGQRPDDGVLGGGAGDAHGSPRGVYERGGGGRVRPRGGRGGQRDGGLGGSGRLGGDCR